MERGQLCRAFYRDLNHYRSHFGVYMKYRMLQVCKESKSIILENQIHSHTIDATTLDGMGTVSTNVLDGA